MLKKLVRPLGRTAIAAAAGLLVPGAVGTGILSGAWLPDVAASFAGTAAPIELSATAPASVLRSAYRLRITQVPEAPADVTHPVGAAPIMAPTGCPFEVRAIVAGGGDAFAIVAAAPVGPAPDPTRDTRLVRRGDRIATARGRAEITTITASAVTLTLNAAAIRCELNER